MEHVSQSYLQEECIFNAVVDISKRFFFFNGIVHPKMKISPSELFGLAVMETDMSYWYIRQLYQCD